VTFEWLETLGHGTYGQVSKVRESSTGTIYAQKTIRVTDPRLAAVFERQVQNEVQIMQELRHHHIASVQFYVRDPDAFSMIMLPVADYDLQTFLQHICINAGFPTTELTRLTSWFGCLVSALAFVHANKIKHEDIKPRNILIKDSQPYLADFGCAQDFSEWESSVSPDNLVHGTPVYWAPEDPPRRRAADVFSLGCVFSEMLTVRQNKTLEDYRTYRRRNSNNPNAFSGNLVRVYEWLEQLKEPHDRTGDILIEQILLMLDRDPRRRAEARYVKRALPDAVFCYTCW
jgi:serine/threonine protein kinase